MSVIQIAWIRFATTFVFRLTVELECALLAVAEQEQQLVEQ